MLLTCVALAPSTEFRFAYPTHTHELVRLQTLAQVCASNSESLRRRHARFFSSRSILRF